MAYSADVCFTESDSKLMVVELEKGRNCSAQLDVLERATAELEKQNRLLREQIELKQQQIEITTREIENERTICKAKVKACEDSKPAWWEKWAVGLGGLGIGVVIGAVLVVL